MSMPPPPANLPQLPRGWVRANVPSPVVKRAHEVMRMPFEYGQGIVETINGTMYAFRREPHYDDHVGGILMWHPGISVWTRADSTAEFPPGMQVQALSTAGQVGRVRLGDAAALGLGMMIGYGLFGRR